MNKLLVALVVVLCACTPNKQPAFTDGSMVYSYVTGVKGMVLNHGCNQIKCLYTVRFPKMESKGLMTGFNTVDFMEEFELYKESM